MKAHADGDLAECVLFSLDPVFYGVVISKGRVLSAQTSQSLSNDLQLSLDDKLQGAITAKILEGFVPTKGLNLFDGSQNVLI